MTLELDNWNYIVLLALKLVINIKFSVNFKVKFTK